MTTKRYSSLGILGDVTGPAVSITKTTAEFRIYFLGIKNKIWLPEECSTCES